MYYKLNTYTGLTSVSSISVNNDDSNVEPPATPDTVAVVSKTTTTMTFSMNVDATATTVNAYLGGVLYQSYARSGGGQYTVTGLTVNTEYEVSFTAENSGGESSLTPTTTTYTRPNPPTSLAMTERTATTATFTWSAPASGGANAYDFRMDGISQGAQTSPYTINGLNDQIAYTASVVSLAADNTESTGNPTVYVHKYVLDAPGSFAVVVPVSGTTSLDCSWAEVTGATSYTITDDSGVADYASGIGGTSHTITGLDPNTSYTYRVKAVNNLGSDGTLSANDSCYTRPEQPTSLALTARTSTTATVTWSDPVSGADHYELYIDNVSGGTVTSPHEQLALDADTAYTFEVRSVNADGGYSTSNPTVHVHKYHLDAPINFSMTPAASVTDKLDCSWGVTPDATSYSIVNDNGLTVYASDIVGTSYELTGLDANTSYERYVLAVHSLGSAGVISMGDTCITRPNPPSVTGTSDRTSNNVNVIWTAGVGGASYYKVYDGTDTLLATTSSWTGGTIATPDGSEYQNCYVVPYNADDVSGAASSTFTIPAL